MVLAGGHRLAGQTASGPDVPRWGVFEASFTSARTFENPFQEATLTVTFTGPGGGRRTVDGFWDGGATWRVRFSPDEIGEWRYETTADPSSDPGLHGRQGTFRVTAPRGSTRFDRHGPVRVAKGRTHLEHADGTPFFWLADTAWNGALLSTPEEWARYLKTRARQRFNAVQWVATQWRAAPRGDRLNERAYTGTERIVVNTAFFRRLDEKARALNAADLLNIPVLLWAIASGSDPSVNPGVSLPEDQAIRLARYMVARWQAYDVIWILAGDGDYRGERAERWKRIGRGVFGDRPHAPALMHPGGMHWILNEFIDEPWFDILGYQSGHGDDDRTLRWMTEGPPSREWKRQPIHPFINLEPPYEYHIAYQSKARVEPHTVRRAVYWSLLNAPTAGVSYGGHGVWGWDDGTRPPTDHAGTGIPLPWEKALVMPGAEQMAHVSALFESIDFHRLRPAPAIVAMQPGRADGSRYIAAAVTESSDLLVVYTPVSQRIVLSAFNVPTGRAEWFDPRTGARTAAQFVKDDEHVSATPPGEGDWVLVVKR